jgi:peptidoglycan/LPS O-acetylase OafA/YrhL
MRYGSGMESSEVPAVTSVGTRIPALDGVRGIAILLVISAHAFYGVRPFYRPLIEGWYLELGGGFSGVQLFFVLSGYLITRLLLRELEQDGRIDWKGFYLRRLRRLYPALILTCLGFLGMGLYFGLPLDPMLREVMHALTYTTNLHGHGNRGTWLAHAWSLGVEEQFYLAWPLCLALLWRSGRGAILMGCLALSLVAVYLRTISSLEQYEYEVIRWDALLLGCMLALRPPRPGRLLLGLGMLFFAYYSVVPRSNYNTVDYVLCALGCAAFLVYALDARWVAHPVLRYFGRISYGLYLWHLLLLRPGWPMWFTLLLSVLVADLSYRWVERPLLMGGRRPGVRTHEQVDASG